MFKRISYTIALQFTAFVFLLFLINGSLFLLADFGSARRQMLDRLGRNSAELIRQAGLALAEYPAHIPPSQRERIRILDPEGQVIYAGSIFAEMPFRPREGFSSVTIQGDRYAVLTASVRLEERLLGYVQVADLERVPLGDLPFRALLYTVSSVAVSLLTFLVGLYFARRSLKPAAQMMERLEQFTQDASHELRTPLAALNSSLDLALKTGKHREGLVSAKEDVAQVSTLVERLLELARLDTFVIRREQIDLTGLIADGVERFKPLAAEKGIEVRADLKPGVTVRGDAALLRQVLANLLFNAIKFAKSPPRSNDGEIRVMLTADALTVRDTGVGIAPDALPHIFERFYQADSSRSRGGFGLGLALVRRVAVLHGWSVTARSEEGKWTEFRILLASRQAQSR